MATIGWNNPQSQVIDLASSTLQARQLAQQKQQQQIANIMAIAQAYQQQQAQEQENKLKQQQMNTEQDIGFAKLGLIPSEKGDILIGNKKYSRLQPQTPDISKMFGGMGGDNLGGLGVTGATVDPMSGDVKITLGQTPESKVKQESNIAKIKENEVAIGKAERLKSVSKTIENEWLKTSPYGGAITKTGLVPLLGAWDIIKKGAGATNAQRQDQTYATFIQGIRAQLARGMGDVGNLSEYEQRAVVQLVPNLMDSYESGRLKLGKLAQLVEDIKSTRGGGQGVDMQSFVVNGITYNIPNDQVEAFKKAKGIK